MNFLDGYNKLTRAEVGILLFILLTTFRICLLPALIAEVSGESSVYVVMAGLGIDLIVCLICIRVATLGGLEALRVSPVVKRALGVIFALFFLFKVTLRVYEAVDYCVNELFDQAAPFLLAVTLVITAALLASKGFAGIARTGILYLLVVIFLAVLSVFFVAFNGFEYNFWSLLRPKGVGEGILRSVLWLGDGAVLLFADIRGEAKPRKQFLWGGAAFAVVVIGMLFFFLNFIFTYGSAGRYIRYAFVRMLTNGDPEELGAVDWPVMLIWLLSVPLHIATQFYAGCEGLRIGVTRKEHGGVAFLTCGVVAVTLTYFLLFSDKDGFTRLVESQALSYVMLAVLALTVVLFVFSAVNGKRKQKVAL